MSLTLRQRLKRVLALMEIPAPDPPQLSRRIASMERDIILPLKVVVAIILFQSFYYLTWFGTFSNTLAVAVEFTRYFYWVFVGINALMAILLLAMRRLPLALIQWSVFTVSLVDGLFLAALTLVTGGYDSLLYWLFIGLIIRNAISFPPTISQLVLNFGMTACYIFGGLADIYVWQILDPASGRILEMSESPENPAEPLLVRVVLLVLMTLCCYGLQILLERERLATEEAREFGMREGQLRSAGRLAAEFAHQIKNPLTIINNASFSLQRALKEGRADASRQIEIIQEEVERSDRIITQILDYAQLTEGRVEKLSVVEEIEQAISRVFPSAANDEIQLDRHYEPYFPPLFMQRRHFSEILVNIFQNAREALNGRGNISVTAGCHADYSIDIVISDNGPGISADKLAKIFEAYYTSKEKGTGLGLAIVKHNTELYGGTVRVESELGKGAQFTLTFPAKTMINLTRPR